MASNALCPGQGCVNVVDFTGAVLVYDDGDFYTAEARCDTCGARVQATVEISVVVVIDGQKPESRL